MVVGGKGLGGGVPDVLLLGCRRAVLERGGDRRCSGLRVEVVEARGRRSDADRERERRRPGAVRVGGERAGRRAGRERDRACPRCLVRQAERLELDDRRPDRRPGRGRERRGGDRRELWRPARERLPQAAERCAGKRRRAPARQTSRTTGRLVSGVGVVDGGRDPVEHPLRLVVEVRRAQSQRVARRPGEPDSIDRRSRGCAERSVCVDLAGDEILHLRDRRRRPAVGVAPRPGGVPERDVGGRQQRLCRRTDGGGSCGRECRFVTEVLDHRRGPVSRRGAVHRVVANVAVVLLRPVADVTAGLGPEAAGLEPVLEVDLVLAQIRRRLRDPGRCDDPFHAVVGESVHERERVCRATPVPCPTAELNSLSIQPSPAVTSNPAADIR